MESNQTAQAQNPLTRAAIALVLAASGGWIAFAVVITFTSGWPGVFAAAFVIPASGLATVFAWPQLDRSDPARRSTLILLLSVMLVIGLLTSIVLWPNDDETVGLWRWLGPAAAVTATLPLVMLKMDRSSGRPTGLRS